MPKISESVSLHIPGADGQTPAPIDVSENKTPLGWTSTAKGSPVFNIPGLAAPKVRILPGRIVDKVRTESSPALMTPFSNLPLHHSGHRPAYHKRGAEAVRVWNGVHIPQQGETP